MSFPLLLDAFQFFLERPLNQSLALLLLSSIPARISNALSLKEKKPCCQALKGLDFNSPLREPIYLCASRFTSFKNHELRSSAILSILVLRLVPCHPKASALPRRFYSPLSQTVLRRDDRRNRHRLPPHHHAHDTR